MPHKFCLCDEVYYSPQCPVHCRSYHEGERPKWKRAFEIKKELAEDHSSEGKHTEHLANLYMDRCAELISLIRGKYDIGGRE